MTYLVLFLLLTSLLGARFSFGGRRFRLYRHPAAVASRYLGLGVLLGAWLERGHLYDTDAMAWLGLALLALGAARRRVPSAHVPATIPIPRIGAS